MYVKTPTTNQINQFVTFLYIFLSLTPLSSFHFLSLFLYSYLVYCKNPFFLEEEEEEEEESLLRPLNEKKKKEELRRINTLI